MVAAKSIHFLDVEFRISSHFDPYNAWKVCQATWLGSPSLDFAAFELVHLSHVCCFGAPSIQIHREMLTIVVHPWVGNLRGGIPHQKPAGKSGRNELRETRWWFRILGMKLGVTTANRVACPNHAWLEVVYKGPTPLQASNVPGKC